LPAHNWIAVTGCGQWEVKQRAKAAGFDDHLLKPFDFPGAVTGFGSGRGCEVKLKAGAQLEHESRLSDDVESSRETPRRVGSFDLKASANFAGVASSILVSVHVT
jgi:CheY-like chemotaxis protein